MQNSPANISLDELDKHIINHLQDGLTICDQPYLEAANKLGISEQELIARLESLLDQKVLSRFGPMYHAERMGGGLSLAAMRIPKHDFDQVCDLVNSQPEIAHNYKRDHKFNMWFVIATERVEEVETVKEKIEALTGYAVYNMPKIEEFYVGLRFNV